MDKSFPALQGESLRRMEAAGEYNRWLFERCRPYLGRRVLDAGAGIGTFTELAAAGREVVALEPDPAFGPLLRRRFEGRPEVTVLEQGVEQVSGRFDSVICLNVLEHIRDDSATLARFFDVLAPRGCLLLLVPAHPFMFGAIDRAVGHERRYRRSDLRGLLRRAGFEVETLRLVNPLGALGWLVSSRILRRDQVPEGPLRLYDKLVPVLRALDRIRAPFGLSVWAVARRPGVGAAEHAQEERSEHALEGKRDEG